MATTVIATDDLLNEVLDFLISQPSLEQIAHYHASEDLQERSRELVERQRTGQVTAQDERDLERIARFNAFINLVKARAWGKLKQG